MTAHAVVLSYGPTTAVICPDCRLNDRYPRTKPAQQAARDHNRTTHDKDQPHD